MVPFYSYMYTYQVWWSSLREIFHMTFLMCYLNTWSKVTSLVGLVPFHRSHQLWFTNIFWVFHMMILESDFAKWDSYNKMSGSPFSPFKICRLFISPFLLSLEFTKLFSPFPWNSEFVKFIFTVSWNW